MRTPSIPIPKPTIRTVIKNNTTQYQVVYKDAVVATVDTLYAAQQTASRIVINPANPQ